MLRIGFIGLAMLTLAVTGCAAETGSDTPSSCQGGRATTCSCGPGAIGMSACTPDGRVGQCICPSTGAGRGAAGIGSGVAGRSGIPGVAGTAIAPPPAGTPIGVPGGAGSVSGPPPGGVPIGGAPAGPDGALPPRAGSVAPPPPPPPTGMPIAGAAPPPPPAGPPKPIIPPKMGECPRFTNGATVRIGRMPVVIYIDANAKSKPAPGGPLINYYHATLGLPSEVLDGFGLANIRKVTDMGGVVASYSSTSCDGCATTDDFYWYVEDGPIQDQVLACAMEQANIDVNHIHALGWSAGALHSTWVGINRSNYMASFISYSGGMPPWPFQSTSQNPAVKVSSILTYGAIDNVVVDFPTQSKAYYDAFSPKGWYTMMCYTGGGHMIDGNITGVSLKFFMDHPFNTTESPYKSMIPAGFPRYCSNMKQ